MSEKYHQNFIEIIKKLRDPKEGCPWDLKQTHASLKKYVIEEAYEVCEAIDLHDDQHLKEELGDLLLQVYLHSQLASERNAFHIDDVLESISNKMIRRHPHVFEISDDNEQKPSIDELHEQWARIKNLEKNEKIASQSTAHKDQNFTFNLKDLYAPALLASEKIGQKSQDVDFDWDNATEVFEKVKEEFIELKEAFLSGDLKHIHEEAGDLLFSVSQFLRHLGLSSEESLNEANKKFVMRFQAMEKILGPNENILNISRNEKEKLWKRAKKALQK